MIVCNGECSGGYAGSSVAQLWNQVWGVLIFQGSYAGTKLVYVRAANENDSWHQVGSLTVGPPETVSTPAAPSGPASGVSGTSYTFTTGGSSSNYGNPVQYQFGWGDGTYSGWLPAGTASASHTWAAGGTFTVTAQAITSNTSVTSAVSAGTSITVAGVMTVTLQTSPSGLQITIGGNPQTAPYTWRCTSGSLAVGVSPTTQNGATGVQYVYASWSDGGAQSHSINCPASNQTVTANFNTQYLLTTAVSGPGTVTPATGWYNSGTQVTITATPSAGNVFQGFSGTSAGSADPFTVTMNGPTTETAQFGVNYTISVLQGTATVAPGGNVTYTLQVSPAGYPGTISELNFVAACSPTGAGQPGGFSFGSLISNPDGTLSVVVVVAQSAATENPCPGPTYLSMEVLGSGPYLAETKVSFTLSLQITNTLSLSSFLLSKTANTSTYMVSGYANFGGTSGTAVALSVTSPSCALLLGSPTMTMKGTPSTTWPANATVSVATAACPAGQSVPLTISGSGGGTSANTSATLTTAPNAAVMTTPPPGATIPGGATSFSWSQVARGTYTLSVGASPGGTDYASGAASPGVNVALPTSGVVYATLATQVNGVWQPSQQYTYTVNPNPAPQSLTIVAGPAFAAVGNNGTEVQYVYHFTGGDATLLNQFTTNVAGVTSRIVSQTKSTVTVGLRAPVGTAAQLMEQQFCDPNDYDCKYPCGPGDSDCISTSGGGVEEGPEIEVYPLSGMVGQQFTITEDDDLGGGTLQICQLGVGCREAFPFSGTYQFWPAAGSYTAQFFVGDDDPDDEDMATDPMPFFVNPESSAPPTTISYNGSTIASSAGGVTCVFPNCSVVVGQQITVTGSPSGGTWSIGGTVYSQWNGQDGSPPTPVNLSSDPVSFYWVTGGRLTVSYTAGGSTASVTFSVAAPTVSAFDAQKADPYVSPVTGYLVATLNVTATVTPPRAVSWHYFVGPGDANPIRRLLRRRRTGSDVLAARERSLAGYLESLSLRNELRQQHLLFRLS